MRAGDFGQVARLAMQMRVREPGEGNGLVSERALELALNSPIQKGATSNAVWTKAKSLGLKEADPYLKKYCN